MRTKLGLFLRIEIEVLISFIIGQRSCEKLINVAGFRFLMAVKSYRDSHCRRFGF